MKCVRINVEKMETLRTDLGLDQKDFSRRIFHEDSWYSSIKKRGTASKSDVALIKHEFGVDLEVHDESYGYATNTEAHDAIDYDRLEEIVKNAIDYEKLGKVMAESMRSALS